MSVYRPGYHRSTMCLPSRLAGWMVDSVVHERTPFTLTTRLPSICVMDMVDTLVDTNEPRVSADLNPFFYYLPSTFLKKEKREKEKEKKVTRARLVVGSHFPLGGAHA